MEAPKATAAGLRMPCLPPVLTPGVPGHIPRVGHETLHHLMTPPFHGDLASLASAHARWRLLCISGLTAVLGSQEAGTRRARKLTIHHQAKQGKCCKEVCRRRDWGVGAAMARGGVLKVMSH